MKKIVWFALSLIFISIGCNRKNKEASADKPEQPEVQSTKDNDGYIVQVGEEAPDFTVKRTDGTEFTLSRHRGKVVLLQFTASWCGVCRREMPYIEKDIWQPYRNNPDFVLLAIDREEPLEKILPFIEATGITYPVALDPDAGVFQLYAEKNAGITRNVLIGRDGRIVMLTRLFNEEEFKNLVRETTRLLSDGQDNRK